VRLDLPDRSLELVTDRGVFSADRVDPGTRYLLLEAPAPPASGTFVDLGAGYGPIACTLALRSPAATVWAVEVNQRARELCALNADRAGAGNVRVAAPRRCPPTWRWTSCGPTRPSASARPPCTTSSPAGWPA
jgi:16S rRNA (guanine1207-N2)-methyltransferase